MATVIDDFSPMFVGDTLPPFAPTFLYKDGTALNLTGATFSMKMQEQTTGVVKTCGGAWTIDDAANGKAHYSWQAVDTNTPGNWRLYVTITIGGGSQHADYKMLEILPTP